MSSESTAGTRGESTTGSDTVGGESTEGTVVVCDETCALSDLEEAWTVRLVDDMQIGPIDPYFQNALQPDGSLLLTVRAPPDSMVVRVSPEGAVSVFEASMLGFEPDAMIWSTFAGPSGVVLAFSQGSESGLARYTSDFEFVCDTASSERIWTEVAAESVSTWGLFAVELPTPGNFSVSVGDPCAPPVDSLLNLDPEDAAFPVSEFAFNDAGSLLLAGYLPNSDKAFFVRTYDGDGQPTGSWSDSTLELRTSARAHWLSNGHVLVAGWSAGTASGVSLMQTAYVDPVAGTAEVASYDGLWRDQPGGPRVALSIDPDGTPRMVYGDRVVRVTRLPGVDALPCCPGTSALWQEDGIDEFAQFYATDDGVLAVTGADSLETPDAYDIVVTRFVFSG